jgi:hypothetical protein
MLFTTNSTQANSTAVLSSLVDHMSLAHEIHYSAGFQLANELLVELGGDVNALGGGFASSLISHLNEQQREGFMSRLEREFDQLELAVC